MAKTSVELSGGFRANTQQQDTALARNEVENITQNTYVRRLFEFSGICGTHSLSSDRYRRDYGHGDGPLRGNRSRRDDYPNQRRNRSRTFDQVYLNWHLFFEL